MKKLPADTRQQVVDVLREQKIQNIVEELSTPPYEDLELSDRAMDLIETSERLGGPEHLADKIEKVCHAIDWSDAIELLTYEEILKYHVDLCAQEEILDDHNE